MIKHKYVYVRLQKKNELIGIGILRYISILISSDL